MTVSKTIWRSALAAAALMSLGACVGTAPPPPPGTALASSDCFSSTQWRGWSSPIEDVVYLRVGVNDIYRLDLLPGSGRIDSGGRFIISEVRGSNRICSANDLQLWTADTIGFRTPLFPRAIRKLTPEEVAALPPDHRP
jgi:hypothetical protein